MHVLASAVQKNPELADKHLQDPQILAVVCGLASVQIATVNNIGLHSENREDNARTVASGMPIA